LTARPTEGLMLQLGLGYTDSELVSSDLFSSTVPNLPQSSIEGTNTPNYSKFTGSFLGRYDWDFAGDLAGRLQLEYSYRTERDLNLVTNPQEAAILTEPSVGLMNLRLGVGSGDGTWDVLLFVENVTDESYRVLWRDNGLRGAQTLYGNPRMWGVSFAYNWGN